MGQKASQPLTLKDDSQECLDLQEVFSGAIMYAAQMLEEYLAFEDHQGKFCPTLNTLNEIFLVHFITFCKGRGLDRWLSTTKMTKHQTSLFGADWIWTFWDSDREIRLQLAVQTRRLSSPPPVDSKPCDASSPEPRIEDFRKKSRFDKLEEFCNLVGKDCVGLFIIFGVPGKATDIRGVVLDSVLSEAVRSNLSGGKAVVQSVLETEQYVSVSELLGNCLSKSDGLRELGKVYIKIL
ncbi:rab15 effector protein [Rhynchocyon petersi]